MKNQINTMSTSFLDLLSGALGAVILLFVIVPKTSYSDLELVEQIKALDLETEQVDSILVSLQDQRDQISLEEYNAVVTQVQNQMTKQKLMAASLAEKLQVAQNSIKELKREGHSIKTENKQLQNSLAQLNRKKTTTTKKSTKSQKTTVVTTTSQKSSPSPKRVKDSDKSFYFGFDSELSIVINWDTVSKDVDLYLEKEGSYVDGFNRTKSFGKWVRVPKKYLSKPTEVIIQQKLVPGKYKIHAHLSKPRRNAEATITGFVAMDKGGDKTQKINFKKKTIKSSPPPYHKRADGSTLIGELIVTENSISFN